jgi:ribonuclease E
MTEPTDTFADLARRGHQVFTAAARAWEDAVRSMVEAARRPGERLPDVRASLDAAFEFAAQMLAEQREFAKTVMAAGAGALAAERTVPDDGPGTAERSDVRPYATPGTPAVEKPAEAGEPGRQDDTTAPTEPPALPPAAEDRPDETAADAAVPAVRQATTAAEAPVAKKTAPAEAAPAKRTAARKTAARKTAARKTASAEAAPAEKTAARKTTTKKTAAAKKTPAKKTAAAKAPAARKSAAKKTEPRKTAAPGKKSAAAEVMTAPSDGDQA